MKNRANIIFISVVFVLVAALVFSGFTIHKKNKNITKAEETITQNETDIKEKDERIAKLEEELKGSKSENEKIKSELNSANTEKDKLQKENSNLKKEIENLKANKKTSAQAAVNTASQNKNSATTKPKPVVSSSGNKVCYLTFDDGPSARTLEILNILKKYNVKATFFVINSSNIDYIKKIHEEGHAIGLHAYEHNYAKIYKNTTAYFKDLQAISDKVESLTGVKTNIMRFPGGSSNVVSKNYCKGIMTTLSKEVTKKGYVYFDWNVDSDDAGSSHSSYTRIVNNVLNGSNGKNSICVLMHDASSKTSTVQALPKIIEGLSARGFRFETLSDKVTGFHHGINN